MEIYKDLREHLDKMPVGYPKTDSGVEISLLQKLFTLEEAFLATKLNFFPLNLKKIYRRLKDSQISLDEVNSKLDSMFNKGLIMKSETNGQPSYSNLPFVLGIWEFQLGRLTPEVASDTFQYFYETFFENGYNKTGIPQMRTIPIEKAIKNELTIATYDQARDLVESSNTIGLMGCICRMGKDLIGEHCKRTDLRETCLTFGVMAKIRYERGVARLITKKEALKLLEKSEKAGLVLQPSNSQKPMVICSCCGCCCEVLSSQRRIKNSARLFATNFYAEVNLDDCIGCGACIQRCNIDAKTLNENKCEIDIDSCIGCGVCIPTCPQNAIRLIKKIKETIPPKNIVDTYTTIMNKKAKQARKFKNDSQT